MLRSHKLRLPLVDRAQPPRRVRGVVARRRARGVLDAERDARRDLVLVQEPFGVRHAAGVLAELGVVEGRPQLGDLTAVASQPSVVSGGDYDDG